MKNKEHQTGWMTLACCMMMCALSMSCVTTASEGEKMRSEIDVLKARQDALGVSLKEREASMASMIAQARKENESLKILIKKAQDTLQKSDAEVGVDMQQMRTELDQLRGQIEEASFRQEKLAQDLKLFKEDVDLRLEDATKTPLPSSPAALLSFSKQQFKDKNYQESKRGAEAFVQNYGSDKRLDQAYYLLGESHFFQKQYISSIYAYQNLLKKRGASKLVPDAAYRIGVAFFELGRCDKSKLFLNTVATEYKKRKTLAKQAKAAMAKPCKPAS